VVNRPDPCPNKLDPAFTYGREGVECGDEGQLCDDCIAIEMAYWSAYFGQTEGDPEGNRRRLEAMKPFDREEYEAAWRFKNGGHDE
jgi:hypothetical protein